jgi:hypothetical protein
VPHGLLDDEGRGSVLGQPRSETVTEAVHREAGSDTRLVPVLGELAAQVLPKPLGRPLLRLDTGRSKDVGIIRLSVVKATQTALCGLLKGAGALAVNQQAIPPGGGLAYGIKNGPHLRKSSALLYAV